MAKDVCTPENHTQYMAKGSLTPLKILSSGVSREEYPTLMATAYKDISEICAFPTAWE